MEYKEPVTFVIKPADETQDIESSLTWTFGKGLESTDDAFSSNVALFAVQRTADAQLVESGDSFKVTPEGPTLPTDRTFKDIYAAVYFIYKTFPGGQIVVDGEAPTLEDMGLSGKSVDENGNPIIN